MLMYLTCSFKAGYTALALLFAQDGSDPAQVLRDVRVDVGSIWVVAVSVHVERHDTDRGPVAHQRTTRIPLDEEKLVLLICCLR